MKLTKSKLKEINREELLNEGNDGDLADTFWDYNEALDKFVDMSDTRRQPKGKDYTKDKKLYKIIRANQKAMHILYNHLVL